MDKQRDLIICSVGVHALEMAEIVERINRAAPAYRLRGYFAETTRVGDAGRTLNGYAVLGTIEKLGDYPDAVLAIGNEFNGAFPVERCVSLVDPSAFVSRSATIGRACVIYPQCFVGFKAVLGDRVFALSGCIINHDCVIADRNVMASGVTLAGGVHVETDCYLGQSCSVRQKLRIGKRSLIGMGAVVVKNVEPNSVMAGNPARKLRDRER